MELYKLLLSGLMTIVAVSLSAQKTNPLWNEVRAKNYLPHMTYAEVEEFLVTSDLVIIPVGAMEQHSYHLPLGTDFINGVERCKLIASEREIIVAPVLMAGQSPYHMGFAGTITLKAETIIDVHLQAVNSLIQHGFKRFILMNSHGGNTAIIKLLVDQINQTTPGVAVEFGEAIEPFLIKPKGNDSSGNKVLDRHAGTGETSNSMYLMPSLVQMDKAKEPGKLSLPDHLETMVSEMLEGNTTAQKLFLAEGLKAEETGKQTSTAEMTKTGVWGERNPAEATTLRGQQNTESIVNACIEFIDEWNRLLGK